MLHRASTHTAKESGVPRIAVVIPTRNRGDAALATVRSVLANEVEDVEIVVVDQSDAAPPSGPIDALPANVSWRLSAKRGVARARNEGVACTRAPLIGFVDDDCIVATDWLASLDATLSSDPHCGVVFGNVHAAEHDRRSGFVPAYVRTEPFTARSIAEKNEVEGISACMATTRSAFEALHGFDAQLGAGGELRSGAETDYTIRALLAGYHVIETPRLEVTHHGFRDWDAARALLARYWYGTGATFAKHVRLGNWAVSGVLVKLVVRWLRGRRSALLASSGARSSRTTQATAFARGFLAGLWRSTDRATGHFRTNETPQRARPT